MSKEHVEIARQGYEALNRDGIEGALPFLDREVEFVPVPGFLPDSEHFHGHEGARAWFEKMGEAVAELCWQPQEFIEARDRLVAVVNVSGRGRATEIPAQLTFYQVWTIREGKAVRLEAYVDRRQALDAAGLSDRSAQPSS
jgi:ketosteroid isomerase-like protein